MNIEYKSLKLIIISNLAPREEYTLDRNVNTIASCQMVK